MAKNADFRHVEADGQPSKKSKKSGVKGSVALIKGVLHNWVVCQDSQEKISTERRNIGTKSHGHILQGHVAPHQKIGKERVHREELIQKCEPHERNPCAPRFEDKTQDETLHQERCARREAWDLAKSVKKIRIKLRFTSYPNEARAMLAPTFKISRGTRIRGWLRSINAHAEHEGIELRRSGDSAEIQEPTTVVTANGQVQTNEEAQENVHDLDLFVTVQILDDTPAVLSLGKLCEEHGYTC